MKRLFLNACLLSLSLSLFSCTNEDKDPIFDLVEEICFIYQGNTYYSRYENSGTKKILSDEKARMISAELAEKDELTAYITPKGVIMYFDTYEEACEHMELEEKLFPDFASYPLVYETQLYLYQKINYNSLLCETHLYRSGGFLAMPEEAYDAQSPTLSSFKLQLDISEEHPFIEGLKAYIILDDDREFSGHKIIFTATDEITSLMIPDLAIYPLFPGSDISWGEIALSFKHGFNFFSITRPINGKREN